MNCQVMTFDMCTLDDRGKVKFSQEGLDVIRALLMKWISEAYKGELTALEYAQLSPNPFGSNQAAYFRSARSFLTARLVSHLSPIVNLKTQLATIKEWADNTDVPDGWREALKLATELENLDGLLNSAGGGSGTDSRRGAVPTEMGAGRNGEGGPTAPHPAAPRHHPPAGRSKGRPTTDRK